MTYSVPTAVECYQKEVLRVPRSVSFADSFNNNLLFAPCPAFETQYATIGSVYPS